MITAKEILAKLIEIDTSSPEGNESKAVKYLYELLILLLIDFINLELL